MAMAKHKISALSGRLVGSSTSDAFEEHFARVMQSSQKPLALADYDKIQKGYDKLHEAINLILEGSGNVVMAAGRSGLRGFTHGHVVDYAENLRQSAGKILEIIDGKKFIDSNTKLERYLKLAAAELAEDGPGHGHP
jgi:hypothetical protein